MADILGISQRTYAWWESGKDIPFGKLAPLKEKYPDLDMNWFLRGKGPVYIKTPESLDQEAAEFITEIIDTLSKIDSKDYNVAKRVLKGLEKV